MSQQNNSHPLTEEIINEFREKFVAKAEDAEDPEAGWDGWKDDVLPDEVQAYLLSSLTRVREDERKRIEKRMRGRLKDTSIDGSRLGIPALVLNAEQFIGFVLNQPLD